MQQGECRMNTEQEIVNLNVHPDAKAMLFALLQENLALREQVKEMDEKLVDSKEAMQLLGCGRKKFWELSKVEGFPLPVQFGKSNYYRVQDLVKFRNQYQQNVNS